MKRMFAVLGATALPVMVAVTVVSFAQQPQSPDGGVVVERVRTLQGPEGGPPMPPPPADFFFVTSEVNFSGKVVKGAPYSAQGVTETIQTLSDGNRIVNRSTATLYRDGEGRTRREQTLKPFGAGADAAEGIQSIFINDPVAGVSYALDSRSKIAHKTAPYKVVTGGAPGFQIAPLPPGGGANFEYKVEGGGAGSRVEVKPATALPPSAQGAPAPLGDKIVVSSVGTATTYVFSEQGSKNAVTEK